MTDTKFGNGKILAELLKKEFSAEHEVTISDVKEVTPKFIAEQLPDVIVLGGAIRMFKGGTKSKKWLKELDNSLKRSGKKIMYGCKFLYG